jgi:hypothetical protein
MDAQTQSFSLLIPVKNKRIVLSPDAAGRVPVPKWPLPTASYSTGRASVTAHIPQELASLVRTCNPMRRTRETTHGTCLTSIQG